MNTMNENFEVQNKLQAQIADYVRMLSRHPVRTLAEAGRISRTLLEEFAKAQYVDSSLWVTMLSLAKGRVRSKKLSEAITKNILCETGHDGLPHITSCQRFVESLGIEATFGESHGYAPLASHALRVMNAFDHGSEGIIAGWLLVAETLVPELFKMFRPAFLAIQGVDLHYLDEHIAVDADEHALWMMEAACELATEGNLIDVEIGIALGGRVLLSVPDALYAKALQRPAHVEYRRAL